MPHFGKIEEIIIVSYHDLSRFEEHVFKCRWFKVNLVGDDATVVQDECGFTRVRTSATNFQTSRFRTSEPFAFPCHLEQCFFIPYPPAPEEWSFVITYVPRSRSVIRQKEEVIIVDEEDEDI